MKILCKRSELNLKCTLTGGQSFRWQEVDGKWIGVFAHRIWILQQNDDFLSFEVFKNLLIKEDINNQKGSEFCKGHAHFENSESENQELLRNYLRLDDLNLEKAYQDWSAKDKHFKNVCDNFQGVRILNQDPVENLFSFICSTNNNISRISSMVEKLCTLYGEEIGCINGKKYYDFPSISSLATSVVEAQLRSAGFGYRARYVHKSAEKLVELGGRKWLENLTTLTYTVAREQLTHLPGVGTKVADCVCLMSLGFLDAVPVDTHIFKVASQWYLPSLRNSKTATPSIQQEVGDFFRDLYGPFAGWAHTILFCSSLKMFDIESKCKSAKEKPRKRKKP